MEYSHPFSPLSDHQVWIDGLSRAWPLAASEGTLYRPYSHTYNPGKGETGILPVLIHLRWDLIAKA